MQLLCLAYSKGELGIWKYLSWVLKDNDNLLHRTTSFYAIP
jgi:hypothetical protein